MDEQTREKLREKILELYGLDINQAKSKFSTQNYAFIFPGGEFMIRVSPRPNTSRSQMLSELLWVDDLKAFKETICEPAPSKNDRLIEEIEIDGIPYRITQFRTAVGSVIDVDEVRPMFLIAVGDLLGGIHRASQEEQELGLHFDRTNLEERFGRIMNNSRGKLGDDFEAKVLSVLEKVKQLPRDADHYGINHGDFHHNNFFVNANNVWLFDFADSLYAPFLYDIASLIISLIQIGYKQGKDPRKIIDEDILPYLKTGYALNRDVDEEFWKDLDLLLEVRLLQIAMVMTRLSGSGVTEDFQKIKDYYLAIGQAENTLDTFFKLSKEYGGIL